MSLSRDSGSRIDSCDRRNSMNSFRDELDDLANFLDNGASLYNLQQQHHDGHPKSSPQLGSKKVAGSDMTATTKSDRLSFSVGSSPRWSEQTSQDLHNHHTEGLSTDQQRVAISSKFADIIQNPDYKEFPSLVPGQGSFDSDFLRPAASFDRNTGAPEKPLNTQFSNHSHFSLRTTEYASKAILEKRHEKSSDNRSATNLESACDGDPKEDGEFMNRFYESSQINTATTGSSDLWKATRGSPDVQSRGNDESPSQFKQVSISLEESNTKEQSTEWGLKRQPHPAFLPNSDKKQVLSTPEPPPPVQSPPFRFRSPPASYSVNRHGGNHSGLHSQAGQRGPMMTESLSSATGDLSWQPLLDSMKKTMNAQDVRIRNLERENKDLREEVRRLKKNKPSTTPSSNQFTSSRLSTGRGPTKSTPTPRGVEPSSFSPGTQIVAELAKKMDIPVGHYAELSLYIDKIWDRLTTREKEELANQFY